MIKYQQIIINNFVSFRRLFLQNLRRTECRVNSASVHQFVVNTWVWMSKCFFIGLSPLRLTLLDDSAVFDYEKIMSEFWMVDNRCAITRQIRPLRAFSNAFLTAFKTKEFSSLSPPPLGLIAFSFSVSSAEVASIPAEERLALWSVPLRWQYVAFGLRSIGRLFRPPASHSPKWGNKAIIKATN